MWEFARENGYAILTFDGDLAEMNFVDLVGYHQVYFDWNLILAGSYNFELSDSTILLQADRESWFYQYNLIKK